jgi:HD-GYP domain-containing protein (c-di-GMP phosphodiesterase class II)
MDQLHPDRLPSPASDSGQSIVLSVVLDAAREISDQNEPERVARLHGQRMRALIPSDQTLFLSRRDLSEPQYHLTAHELSDHDFHPWKDDEHGPVLSGGLLAALFYADAPYLINDLRVEATDPAAAELRGYGSLLAIPLFDQGRALSMIVLLRKQPGAFDPAELPQAVLLGNLYGRAIHGLAAARQLQHANDALKEQFSQVAQLSDTVLDQALHLKRHTRVLEETVRERTRELREAHLDAIYMLAVASEAKDEDTGAHVRRIKQYSELIAREMGASAAEAEHIGYAAVLHDVGKMHVPDQILKKPGPLTPEEREVMQQHAVMGERILGETPFFAMARQIARGHHENWDGSGYPDRLAGEQIAPAVRIVHLADVFDALVSPRVYKAAWPIDRAVQEIKSLAGIMFDPHAVSGFLRVLDNGGSLAPVPPEPASL